MGKHFENINIINELIFIEERKKSMKIISYKNIKIRIILRRLGYACISKLKSEFRSQHILDNSLKINPLCYRSGRGHN